MLEIPLFPLNTVLFPGTPIHLHIFEPRYIKMVNHCVENSQPFGIALIRSGIEALGPLAEPHYIGCTAQIAQIQPLADGQMNLVAIGVERFRVLTIDRETKPFLVGRIQLYPIENPDPAGLDRRCVHLRRHFERFIKILLDAGSQPMDLSQLPDDGVALAFLAAAVLQIPPVQKQELLASESADKLLDRLEHHYLRELALLEVVLSKQEVLQAGGFSIN